MTASSISQLDGTAPTVARVIHLCPAIGCGATVDFAEGCPDHPDVEPVSCEVFIVPGRNRHAEMVHFAALELLAIGEDPAAREVETWRWSPTAEREVLARYQEMRREGVL